MKGGLLEVPGARTTGAAALRQSFPEGPDSVTMELELKSHLWHGSGDQVAQRYYSWTRFVRLTQKFGLTLRTKLTIKLGHLLL